MEDIHYTSRALRWLATWRASCRARDPVLFRRNLILEEILQSEETELTTKLLTEQELNEKLKEFVESLKKLLM